MPFSIAQIVVGLPIPGPFDYLIPANLQGQVHLGQRVYIPFRTGLRVGYVVNLLAKSSFALKSIISLLDNIPILDEQTRKFTKEFSEYYACSWGEAIETALPSILRTKKQISWTSTLAQNISLETRQPQLLFSQSSVKTAGRFLSTKIKAVIAEGRGVIVLVPEVRQILETKNSLEKTCGIPVAILDRTLTPNQKFQEWVKMREGKVRVVVGTRSAVFAPVPKLGLIVVTDEENPAYKQESSPFYHAREVAVLRQQYDQCDLLFVSPAPTAELWKFLKDKKAHIEIPKTEPLGTLQRIDLTNYKPQKNMLVSFPLQNHIQEVLAKEGKVLLFLNRRGFSMVTRCNQCGFVIKCSRCNTNLSFLYSRKKMICHRCGTTSELPKFCPQCKSAYLRSMGTGIEKLESDLVRIYPQARVALFDRDSKNLPANANLVIATQAIITLLNHASFSLIAVLDFDSEINRVDFRAGQRVFSLLVRLRLAASEKLAVQTANPGHSAIKAAAVMDLEKFYRSELKARRELALPPFVHLLALDLRGTKEEAVLTHAKALYEQLQKIKTKNFEISEPEPALTPKLRDKFHFTIMVKGKSVKKIIKLIEPVILDFKKGKGIILTVNVDP